MTNIYIASTDNLINTYQYSSGDWVEKVAKHVRDIYGSNYDVFTDANKSYWDDIQNKSGKCAVANWWHEHSYTSSEDTNKYLLLISNDHWNAGCAKGGSCVMSVGPDLFDVPGPSTISDFYTGAGYGSGMLNGCIHELGHTFGMSYNDGYVCHDGNDDINCRSPMAGDESEDTNNCNESVNKYQYTNESYSHGYYTPCETDYFPSSIASTFQAEDFPCYDNITTDL